MYKIGDFVVYRLLNVCKVQAIEAPSFEADKQKQYYKLSPAFENGADTTIYTPIDTDGLRPVVSAKELKDALAELPKRHPTVCSLRKPPQLTAYYQEQLSHGDAMKNLLLLKEIAIKEKNGGKRLSEIDARFRRKTEKLLCDEFAIALQTKPAEIEKKLKEWIL